MSLPVDLPDPTWRKSSRSSASGNECVEVAGLSGVVAVRDSTDPDGPKLIFRPAEWRAFARRVVDGEPGR